MYVIAIAIGDPHIVTLDQFTYTFNGKGEFVLIETDDDSFTLQARMVPAVDGNNNNVAATVFSAIVCKQINSQTIQFQLDSNKGLVALVDGVEIDLDELKSQEFDNVTVTDVGNSSITATFSSGALIRVTQENDIISLVLVSLPERFKGHTHGLMGSFNDDETDDLLPKNNSTYISINSTIQEIHEEFGISCKINSVYSIITGMLLIRDNK